MTTTIDDKTKHGLSDVSMAPISLPGASNPVAEDLDPALVACGEYQAAVDAFNARCGTIQPSEWQTASDACIAAGDKFADAVPTSAAGAIAKMEEALTEFGESHHGTWPHKHVRAVIAYLEREARLMEMIKAMIEEHEAAKSTT